MYTANVLKMRRTGGENMKKGKLLGKMAEVGITQRELAKYLNIAENTMSSRIRGDSEFRANEISAICYRLNIVDPAEKEKIFLQ